MKTVVIVHHTGEWGGGTKSLIDLCEMLRDDYNVIVCVPKGYPEFVKKISKYGCGVHEISVAIPFINIYSGRPPLMSVVTFRSLKSLKTIKSFANSIRSLNPDVVIFNTLITAVSAKYLSKYTKVICIDRETLTGRISRNLYRHLLDKHLSAITFLSEYEKKKLNFRYSKTTVFPDCVRMDQLKKENVEEIRKKEGIALDKFVILFMGGLAKLKGTDVMLAAIEKLDSRFVLVFAGEMNEAKLTKKQLYHDIKYPGLYLFKKRVARSYYKLRGTTKLLETGLRESIDELIIASDIVAFPSTEVHQPRPCIEAGAYEKPVIISDYKETTEYFRNGYNAIAFKPGNSKELADRIRYACEHPDEMKRLGINNRLMTVTRHDFYECKKIICSLIEKVCNDANKD